jgi:hypothetical protein
MRDKYTGGVEMKNKMSGNDRIMNSSRNKPERLGNQDGTAMVIALLVMILLMGFVALAVSRTNSETVAASNDAAESRTFEAAHASLEIMTRNFSKIFDLKLNPDATDFTRIESQTPPGFDDYTFLPNQKITQTMTTQPVVMTGELFQGLNALRDEWQLDTIAQSKKDGVEVALRRRFFNNRIPIFQFGIFYDDDLEFHPGPRFDFGGRVHSNGNIFLAASTGLYFASKVSAQGEIFTNVQKNGAPWSDWDDNVFIKNASGTFIQLTNTMGSALTTPVNGTAVTTSPLPTTYKSAAWPTNQAKFQGNLLSKQKPLDLPVKLNSNITGTNLDYIELVKRGKNIGDVWNDGTGTVSSPNIIAVVAGKEDDEITEHERYYGKNGMRISLADSKAKLPGCATSTGAAVSTQCGIRLDGNADGLGTQTTLDRGYQPRAMTGTPAYQATRLNGNRIAIPGREVWIKIETNGYDQPTNTYVVADITEDILSFGVTEAAPSLGTSGANFSIQEPSTYYTNNIDKRSIVKLQRFIMDGSDITGQASAANYITRDPSILPWANGAGLKGPYNFVYPAYITSASADCMTATTGLQPQDNGANPNIGGAYTDERKHWRRATVNVNIPSSGTHTKCVVPFPIEMFDTREGLYYEGTTTFDPTAAANYGDKVPWAGVMSMVDIDVANLRDFLAGTYDAMTPTGTPWATANSRAIKSTDIRNANGWVVYVSDRRGDFDFDGEYDMEDVYGNNNGTIEPGEDVNKNNTLQADYTNEAVKYRGTGSSVSPDVAAVYDHKYYRRGVRLVNGTKIPGKYDSTTPANTKGFTFASENAVYVKGNYNATGVASYGTPTPPSDYLPQNTVDHIPGSIAADAVVILSNNWSDSRSFVYPFDLGNRPATETTLRFATLTGDTLTSLSATPNQGGGNPRMSGGVHNFIRFLEDWDNSVNLNYSGSLINLFNSRNNNGTFKCCSIIYVPPERNWVFDTTFLDGNRLPPGTPFFQVIQLTGFQRLN